MFRDLGRPCLQMKNQDIGVLLKLVCLQRAELKSGEGLPDQAVQSMYTVRALELQTGISKTQVNRSLKHCMEIGLARTDRELGVPRAKTKALLEFIIYGLRYVFPARVGELTRGVATSFAAPVLAGKLLSAGEHKLVWPDAHGDAMGQKVEPLFRTAVYAAKQDPEMYALLALIDAVRLGQARERNLASKLLQQYLDFQ